MNVFTQPLNQLFSQSKKIYFVRHGETILNAEHIRQGSEGGLSELGKKQANLTGERLENFPIEAIIVSPFERTKETAEIINVHLKKPLEYSDLLKERRNPSEIIGKPADDHEVTKIVDLIDKSFHDPNLRYSDEENFEDLKARAEALLAYLESRSESNILCVTHGIFLTMVIAVMQFRDKLTPAEYIKITYKYPANNAGITVCEYDSHQKKSPTKGWNLIAWNDYNRMV